MTQSLLTVKGECKVKVRVNECVIDATFVVVDVLTCYPLFGRDWMLLLGFDLPYSNQGSYTGPQHVQRDRVFITRATIYGIFRGVQGSAGSATWN